MDKIGKFLKRLSKEEQKFIEKVLIKLRAGSLQGLDVKKLKGERGLFRVRIGSIRIIFKKEGDITVVIAIERRSDGTYKR